MHSLTADFFRVPSLCYIQTLRSSPYYWRSLNFKVKHKQTWSWYYMIFFLFFSAQDLSINGEWDERQCALVREVLGALARVGVNDCSLGSLTRVIRSHWVEQVIEHLSRLALATLLCAPPSWTIQYVPMSAAQFEVPLHGWEAVVRRDYFPCSWHSLKLCTDGGELITRRYGCDPAVSTARGSQPWVRSEGHMWWRILHLGQQFSPSPLNYTDHSLCPPPVKGPMLYSEGRG